MRVNNNDQTCQVRVNNNDQVVTAAPRPTKLGLIITIRLSLLISSQTCKVRVNNNDQTCQVRVNNNDQVVIADQLPDLPSKG